MATQATSVSVSGNFTLTDSTGSVVFTFSPSFTTLSDTTSGAISTGEILTDGTSDTLVNLPRHHKDLIFTFIKNVDTDYPVAVKPDGDVIANLKPGEFGETWSLKSLIDEVDWERVRKRVNKRKSEFKFFDPGTTNLTKDIIVFSFFNKLLSREIFQFKKGIT